MAKHLAVFALVGLAFMMMVQAEAETAETKTVAKVKVAEKASQDKDEKLVQEEVNFYRALGFYNNYGGRGGFGYGQGQGNVGHNYGYSGYGHNSAPVSHNNGHTGYSLVQNQVAGGPQRGNPHGHNIGYPNGHSHIGYGQEPGHYGNQGYGPAHGSKYYPQHSNSIGPVGSQFGGPQGYGQIGGYYGGHSKGLYSSYVQPGYYGHLTSLGNGHGPNNNYIGNHHNHPYNPYPHPTTHLQQNHHYPQGHYQQQHQQPIHTGGFAPQQEHFGYPVHQQQPQHAKDFGFQYQGQGHQAGNFFPNNNNGFQQNFGFNKKFY